MHLRQGSRPRGAQRAAVSHIATNWAIQQKGLKPASKIVLWHLADRHNPDFGCFPSQERLAQDCEMSRASVNAHLGILEEKGLIHRERRVNAQTRRQESTRYLLAFEDGFPLEKPCPNSGHGPKAVSRNEDVPCPEKAESRVQNLDTNPVREPLREPSRAHTQGEAPAEAGQADEDFQRFWLAHPRPRSRDRTWQAWQAAKAAGAEPARIIEAARRYATVSSGTAPQYRVSSDGWLEGRRWEDLEPGLQACPGPVTPLAEFWAKKIRARAPVAASAINARLAREMVSAGLVGPDDLRRIGVCL